MGELPDGWKTLNNPGHLPIKYHKQYPDGTDAVIEIRAVQDGYEVWSSAEHRASGPDENLETLADDIDSATNFAISEMLAWDEYLTKLT